MTSFFDLAPGSGIVRHSDEDENSISTEGERSRRPSDDVNDSCRVPLPRRESFNLYNQSGSMFVPSMQDLAVAVAKRQREMELSDRFSGMNFDSGEERLTPQALSNIAALAKIKQIQDVASRFQQLATTPHNDGVLSNQLLATALRNAAWNYGSLNLGNQFGLADPLRVNLMHRPEQPRPALSLPMFLSQHKPDRERVMTVMCKFGHLGQRLGQLDSPHGFCMGLNEEIIVADTKNHRICIFDKTGRFTYVFGRPGKTDGCLWLPRKVAVLPHNGNIIVCDRGTDRSRMQVFTRSGEFVHIYRIPYIDIVAGMTITPDGKVVLIDSVRPTIFILSMEKETASYLKHIECGDFMLEPSDIVFYNNEFYICDFKGHSVVVISYDGHLIRKFSVEAVSRFPNGIDISDKGDILVGDSHGNQFHVAVFDRSGSFISHFKCPDVKVSRCCGLRLTSEGNIVTVAKNNHFVLILDALFV